LNQVYKQHKDDSL